MRYTCEHCHAATLEVISLRITQMTRVQLGPDGFALGDAKQCDTEDEITQCTTCQAYGTINHDEYPEFTGDEVCQDPYDNNHQCRDNDITCGCQCEGCIDETEPRCVECNAVLDEQTGRCPL